MTATRTGLDYVPRARHQRYVEHLLERVVVPGGRLVVGVFNEENRGGRLEQEVAVLHPITGRTSRPHQHFALAYKAFWIGA